MLSTDVCYDKVHLSLSSPWYEDQRQQVTQEGIDTNMATLTPKSKVAGFGDPEGCLEVLFRDSMPLGHTDPRQRGYLRQPHRGSSDGVSCALDSRRRCPAPPGLMDSVRSMPLY